MELIVSGVLTKLAFKMSKQLNFDLGEVTLKLLFKIMRVLLTVLHFIFAFGVIFEPNNLLITSRILGPFRAIILACAEGFLGPLAFWRGIWPLFPRPMALKSS